MHKRFRQDVEIAAPLELVREQLAALRHDIPAHDRFAVASMLLRDYAVDGKVVEEFLVRDRIGPGPMAFTFDYHTCITLAETDGTITYNTRLPAGIHLLTRQSVSPCDGRTQVRETIDVTAPLALLGIVYIGVTAGQKAVLAQLKAATESLVH